MFEFDEGDKMYISIRGIQKKVVKGLDVLSAEQEISRSEYLRRILYEHVTNELPKEMINRL